MRFLGIDPTTMALYHICASSQSVAQPSSRRVSGANVCIIFRSSGSQVNLVHIDLAVFCFAGDLFGSRRKEKS